MLEGTFEFKDKERKKEYLKRKEEEIEKQKELIQEIKKFMDV